jgi:hypothetical protein
LSLVNFKESINVIGIIIIIINFAAAIVNDSKAVSKTGPKKTPFYSKLKKHSNFNGGGVTFIKNVMHFIIISAKYFISVK